MSSSNCCFLTCIQVCREADQVMCYSHLFQNFSQFIVIHTVKGFGIVNQSEIDVFLELSCFFHDPADVGNLISGSSAFSKTSLNIREFTVHVPFPITVLYFWLLCCFACLSVLWRYQTLLIAFSQALHCLWQWRYYQSCYQCSPRRVYLQHGVEEDKVN